MIPMSECVLPLGVALYREATLILLLAPPLLPPLPMLHPCTLSGTLESYRDLCARASVVYCWPLTDRFQNHFCRPSVQFRHQLLVFCRKKPLFFGLYWSLLEFFNSRPPCYLLFPHYQCMSLQMLQPSLMQKLFFKWLLKVWQFLTPRFCILRELLLKL